MCFARGKADAALAASIFHFGISDARALKAGAGAQRRSGEAAMLIPSIDLMGGRIVQLVQGEEAASWPSTISNTGSSDSPAIRWCS